MFLYERRAYCYRERIKNIILFNLFTNIILFNLFTIANKQTSSPRNWIR